MNLISSLFLGKPGDFNICGLPVKFTGKNNPISWLTIVDELPFFKPIRLGYLYGVAREMGHAFAAKLLGGNVTHIEIPKTGPGVTVFNVKEGFPLWKLDFISAAGPIGTVSFSIFILIASRGAKKVVRLVKDHFSEQFALAKTPLSYTDPTSEEEAFLKAYCKASLFVTPFQIIEFSSLLLDITAMSGILTEVRYAFFGAIKTIPHNDFSFIAKNSYLNLIVATAALIGVSAFGINFFINGFHKYHPKEIL